MSMNNDLMQQLPLAETDFLYALQNGSSMLASYHQTLSVLSGVLSSAMESGRVGNETLSLAHSVASRISKIASCFLDIWRGEESFTAELQSDCDAMFCQMADLNFNVHPRTSHTAFGVSHPSPYSNAKASSPPFLVSAYQWLLDNLHNPYPTAEVKTRIAATSSCQVSSVSSWFINARRRIGWTTLCREHFSSCRGDMINAAYRALVEEDPHRALSLDLQHSFVAMKVAAEALHPSILTRSALAGDLDAIVREMAEKDGESIEPRSCLRVEQTNPTKTIRDSYPSPARSVVSLPVPVLDGSLTDESEAEEDVTPPVVAGSKRRRSSVEPVHHQSSIRKRGKRLHTSATPRTHFSSPPSSADGVDVSSDGGSLEASPAHFAHSEIDNTLPSRKRRLSDTDATEILKRPRGSTATPHPHTVPDPLLRSAMESEYCIDDWFDTNFDALFAIPPPVGTTEPDFSASWKVELFRGDDISGNSTYPLKPTSVATTDTQVSAPNNFSDFNSLLQSIGGDTLVTPTQSAPTPDVTGALHHPSLGSSTPNIPQTSIDWTSLLNSTEVYQPTVYFTSPQYSLHPQPLPEIDLSMLQLPHVTSTVNSQGDFASKQTKLHQFHVMQEAVRQMERELQAEGIVL